MEKSFYSLRINAEESKYERVSEILSTRPQNLSKGWIFEVENSKEQYFDFINNFLDILENNYEKLNNIGVHKEDISIWLIYEYNDQCNLEFLPADMERLGKNGISLCVSCYEGGS